MLLFARRRQDWCGDVLFALYTHYPVITNHYYFYLCVFTTETPTHEIIQYGIISYTIWQHDIFVYVNIFGSEAIDEVRVALLDLVWHI